jgi:hypothetical protein
MTGLTRRAAAVLAALTGALVALGLGVAAAGPVDGPPVGGPVIAAETWGSSGTHSVVTAVQAVADREVARVVVATRTILHGFRGWSAATFEVLVTALLLLCIAALNRFAPRTESVVRRRGAPRSPPGVVRS